jgi:hypothetical protein
VSLIKGYAEKFGQAIYGGLASLLPSKRVNPRKAQI